MKILVTGANGYIGQHVVSHLLDSGHQVIACDLHDSNIDPRADYMQGNIFEMGEDAYQLFGCPDACLHLSWRDGFNHNSEAHAIDLPKHIKFLQGLVDAGLPQLAVMGSMHEVGYHVGVVDENTPCAPQTQYAKAKNELRDAMTDYCKGRCVLQWLRGYYIIGDDQKNNSIFSKLLRAAEEGKTTFPFTMGRNKYDFIDIDDLSLQICAVLSQRTIDGIINVCSGVPVSLSEKVEKYISDHNLGLTLQYGAYPERPYDSPEIYGDTKKISKIIKQSIR